MTVVDYKGKLQQERKELLYQHSAITTLYYSTTSISGLSIQLFGSFNMFPQAPEDVCGTDDPVQ